MKQVRIILILIIFVTLPLAASAQEDISETYVSRDGSLSFDYPTGWVVEDNLILSVFSNDPDLLTFGPSGPISSGKIYGTIQGGTWRDIAANMDTSHDVSAVGLAQQSFDQASEDTFTLIEGPSQLETDVDAALLAGTYLGTESAFIFIVVDNEYGVVMYAALADGEFSMFRDTLISIVDSVAFEPGTGTLIVDEGFSPKSGESPVRWQQQQPNSDNGPGFARPGTTTVAPDGTIYVALPGTLSIRVLDADGKIIGTLTNSLIRHIDDLVAAPDGTLWVRGNSELLNIGSDGNLITFVDAATVRQSQPYLPVRSFDIGPDGNLYLFRTDALSGGELAIIQVLDSRGASLREVSLDISSNDRLAERTLAVLPNGNFYLAPRRLNLSQLFPDLHDTEAPILVDSLGTVLADDFAAPAFRQFSEQANEIDAINSSYSKIALDVGPDGSIVVATTVGLFVLDSTGALVTHYGKHQTSANEDDARRLDIGEFSSIGGIGVAPNGDVVIADSNSQFTQFIRISVNDLINAP